MKMKTKAHRKQISPQFSKYPKKKHIEENRIELDLIG